VNDTGLPEPPPYIGDKRQFMATLFYDVSDPRRRALYRGYIRQCLDNFADSSNVIQMTSAEYSGPLEFTQFWLDTIVEWEREQRAGSGERGAGSNASDSQLHAGAPAKRVGSVLIGLSAPKDVQDAILADPTRGPHVDVIDIRYWAYTAGGELFAPAGGQNLTPRQHLRQTQQKPGGAGAIVRAVREYRTRFPDKAVIYNADENCPSTRDGWAVIIGGGSLPNVKLPDELARVIPTLRPVDGIVSGPGQWCLGHDGGDYLICTEKTGEVIDVTLPTDSASFRARWVDPTTGEVTAVGEFNAGGPLRLRADSNVLWLSRGR
jgi:hypothetical protein